MVLGSSPPAVPQASDFARASSKEFVDLQATIECVFNLKHIRDMTRTCIQMNHRHKFSEKAQSFGQLPQMVECSFTN